MSHYPKPHGPAMRYRMEIPILAGPSVKAPASPSSFTDGCNLEISREDFQRLLSEPVDHDLLPKYPQGFEYLSGDLSYIKFCRDSDKLALKKNALVLAIAANGYRGKHTDQSTEPNQNVMEVRFNRGIGKIREQNTPGIDKYFQDLKQKYSYVDIKVLDVCGTRGEVIAAVNIQSTVELITRPIDYTNLNGTRGYVAPRIKAGDSAPAGHILIVLRETPGDVKACYYEYVGIAKPQPSPAVAQATVQASLTESRTRTNPRTRDAASRNTRPHRGGFSREIHDELGNCSESESDDPDYLTDDDGSVASSNAMEDPYSAGFESDSEVETAFPAQSATLSKPLTREDKPLSLDQICFGLEDDHESEVDGGAKPAVSPGTQFVFGSTQGIEIATSPKASFDFASPMEGLEYGGTPEKEFQDPVANSVSNPSPTFAPKQAATQYAFLLQYFELEDAVNGRDLALGYTGPALAQRVREMHAQSKVFEAFVELSREPELKSQQLHYQLQADEWSKGPQPMATNGSIVGNNIAANCAALPEYPHGLSGPSFPEHEKDDRPFQKCGHELNRVKHYGLEGLRESEEDSSSEEDDEDPVVVNSLGTMSTQREVANARLQHAIKVASDRFDAAEAAYNASVKSGKIMSTAVRNEYLQAKRQLDLLKRDVGTAARLARGAYKRPAGLLNFDFGG